MPVRLKTRKDILDLLENLDGQGIIFTDEDLVRDALVDLGFKGETDDVAEWVEGGNDRVRELVRQIIRMNEKDGASITEIYEKIDDDSVSLEFITGVIYSADVLKYGWL